MKEQSLIRVISLENLERIRTDSTNHPWYFERLVNNLYELKDVEGTGALVQRCLAETRNEPVTQDVLLNRYFVHLHLAAWLMNIGLLKTVESGNPPCDFELKNGLKIELTRISDRENLITLGAHKIISQLNLQSNIKIHLHVNTLNIKNILSRLKTTLSSTVYTRIPESNQYFNVTVEDRSDILATPHLHTTGPTYLSRRENYDLAITFNKNKIDLTAEIEDKLKHSAASSSHILIIDFTNSVLIKNENDIQALFESIKLKGSEWHISLITGVIFTIERNMLRVTRKYIVKQDRDDKIKEFETRFL